MPFYRYFKRKWLLNRPFPDRWLKLLEQRVPVYRQLPSNYREKLRNHLVILMDEKRFEGCGGLEMTEEMRVVILAYASVMILEETADYYAGLQSILVYPYDYQAPVYEVDENGFVTEGFEHRKGEYWGGGNIVLSWPEIDKQLYEDDYEGNLIYHEFSHLLDDKYGLSAGIDQNDLPIRDDEWTHVLAKAYRRLNQRMYENRDSVLDMYGTESPAEFFSVSTEAFFTKPDEIHRENPDLYRMLNQFYKLDPLRWRG